MIVRPLAALFQTSVVLCSCSFAIAQDNVAQDWAELRRAARERPRTLIYDNDGNDSMRMTELTAENFLAQRTSGFADSNVDTIFYCSNATFGMSTRPSNVWQERNWKDERVVITDGYNVQELNEAGLDSLQLLVDFGKQHDIEIFSSIRMNDVHDHSPNNYGPAFFNNNTFKKAHPEWLLSTAKKRSRTAAWSAVNYLVPEVREHMFGYVREACTDYDVDGVSLDFFRHPAFFPSTFAGKPATAEELQAMTGLIKRIRAMLDEQGKQRGRPILLSIRVPDSLPYCKAIGLDVESWLEQGWIDLVVTSGYFQLNDWQTTAELKSKYDVRVYGSLDEPRIKDEAGVALRESEAGYRGRMSAALAAGLDGVSLFNFRHNHHSPLATQLGDAKLLWQQPQLWFAAVRAPVRANGGNLPYNKYQTYATLTPDTPRDVTADKPVTVQVRVPEPPTESDIKRQLCLRFAGDVSPEELTVSYGGQTLPTGTPGEHGLEWDVSEMPCGLIEVQVALADGKVKWLDVYVRGTPR